MVEEIVENDAGRRTERSVRARIRRINEFLKVDLGDDANTISGLIQEKLGRIPAVGEMVHVGNCRLVVREADPKSIKAVLIQKEEEVTPVQADPMDQASLTKIA